MRCDEEMCCCVLLCVVWFDFVALDVHFFTFFSFRYGPEFVTPLVEIIGDAKQSSELVCAAAELLCKLFHKSDERLIMEAKGD